MLSSRRGASPLTLRSTPIDTVVRERRSRLSCSRFSATKKHGPLLGITANGPGRKIRRWSLRRLGRVEFFSALLGVGASVRAGSANRAPSRASAELQSPCR